MLHFTNTLWYRTEFCPHWKRRVGLGFAVKKLRQYLYGNSFSIFTDFKLSLGLFSKYKPIPSLAAPRVQSWALLLVAYNYKLEYRARSLYGNANCFSRFPLGTQVQEFFFIHKLGTHDKPGWCSDDGDSLEIRNEAWPHFESGVRLYNEGLEQLHFGWNIESLFQQSTYEDCAILWRRSRVVISPKLRLKVS